MDKKGVELSFNVIIIAIIVLLVLVLVGSFFVGGFTKLFDIIFGVGPDSISTASTTCSSQCNVAQTSDDVTKKNSQYCRKTWKFDVNPEDGALDKDIEGNLRKYHCYEPPISVSCTGVQDGVQEFCA